MKQIFYILLFCLAGISSCRNLPDETKPNVLFIAVDDMNNWIGKWKGLAKTPNIDQLVLDGVAFKNAHCVAPSCNPSRASLFTGQRPETTGIYANTGNFREKEGGSERITLPQFLRSKGYSAVAAGKLFHSPRGTDEQPAAWSDPVSWDYQLPTPVGTPYTDLYYDENNAAAWLEGAGDYEGLEISGYLERSGIWGPIPESKEDCGDWKVARFGAEFLQKEHDKPFFLALGIFRPHAPLLAPKEYFDMYPIEDIVLPDLPLDDMEDIPEIARSNWSTGFARKLKSDSTEWKRAVQGYLASSTFADDCVGEILKSLESSRYRDNTIIVFWTDHGWQLGHKDRWEKQALWNQSTHAPMIIRIPKPFHRESIEEHVSLLDIYPTVADLLGYEIPSELEGNSLLPLIKDPDARWDHKAVVTQFKARSVLWKNWNYIRYQDGSEELYNHSTDPDEWHNIAPLPENNHILEELRKSIPGNEPES